MKLVHLYTGEDDRSHFADREIRATESTLGFTSDMFPASAVFVRDTTGGPQSVGFHPAPRRQLVFLLRGSVEYECGDGTSRRLDAGDVLFADDVTGEGHRARVLQSPRLQVFVTVPDDADITDWTQQSQAVTDAKELRTS